MMRRFLFLIAAVVFFQLDAAAQFLREPQKTFDRPTISVNGQASIMAVPDEVVFSLEADNVDLNINVAKAKTDTDIKKLFALTVTYHVPPQQVQTDHMRIARRYGDRLQNKPAPFLGFSVSQRISILLKDISRFDDFLSEIVQAGITQLSDLTFRASDMRKYMDRARSMAMKAAREKAVALAGEIGQRIGKALDITEVGLSVASAYGDDNEDRASSNSTGSISEIIARSLSDNQGTLAPGMISITARVKIVFELN